MLCDREWNNYALSLPDTILECIMPCNLDHNSGIPNHWEELLDQAHLQEQEDSCKADGTTKEQSSNQEHQSTPLDGKPATDTNSQVQG